MANLSIPGKEWEKKVDGLFQSHTVSIDWKQPVITGIIRGSSLKYIYCVQCGNKIDKTENVYYKKYGECSGCGGNKFGKT